MTEVLHPAQEKDWQIIQSLNAEVFANSLQFDPFLDMNNPYSPESAEGYKKAVTDKNTFCMIAEIGGVPAGYLVGSEANYPYRTNKRGEINHMGVSPKFRSHGLGSKLVSEFKKWCKERGITHIAASTYFVDDKARRFYEKNGLTPIDVTFEGPTD